ncbi:hypothetical protein WBG78_00335 [Chryseolinea sp. T2]|uniref:DUF2541 family protein n=1 Tax=Chryseolinea sp. T2 TaxID=3129255 RepID=UPI003077194C
MKKVMIVFAVLFAAIVNFAQAQKPSVMLSDKPGWHKIGEVKADFKMEDQTIAVLGNDRFKSILLKVTDSPINIEDVTVIFENGETQDIHVKSELKAGSETRQIDLKGGSPEIKQVKFTYKTLPNAENDKAHVELYGLK